MTQERRMFLQDVPDTSMEGVRKFTLKPHVWMCEQLCRWLTAHCQLTKGNECEQNLNYVLSTKSSTYSRAASASTKGTPFLNKQSHTKTQ